MAKDIVESERFVLFWGGWPSQWHKARFTIDGITYNKMVTEREVAAPSHAWDVLALHRDLLTSPDKETT